MQLCDEGYLDVCAVTFMGMDFHGQPWLQPWIQATTKGDHYRNVNVPASNTREGQKTFSDHAKLL